MLTVVPLVAKTANKDSLKKYYVLFVISGPTS
jgi:hypothetical protein